MGKYTEEVSKLLFKQILQGIQYLHTKGIVHRDLKPNNILVGAEGQVVKIADFNVAKFYQNYDNYEKFK